MTKHKQLVQAIGLMAMLLAAAFFVRSLWPYLDDLATLFQQRRTVTALATATAIYLLIHGIMGGAWGWLLRSAGLSLPWSQCLAIFSLSQMAKYLPGNFMQHVSRVGLAQRAGLPASKVIVTAFWELSAVLFAGAILSLLAIERLPGESFELLGHDFSSKVSLVAVVSAMLLGGSWPFVSWLRRRSAGDYVANFPTILLACCLAYGLVFTLHGWSLNWIGQAAGAPSDLLLCIGAYTLAWIAGFVTPGAVGGIGVREAVLLIALAPSCGPELAAILAASMRIVSLVGDGLAFLAAVAIQARLLVRSGGGQVD